MKKFILGLLLASLNLAALGQEIIPHSHYQYQRLNATLYSKDTRLHTAMKPVLAEDSLIKKQLDSLLVKGTERTYQTWLGRKLFNEHLVEVNQENFNVYFDFLPDWQIGRDKEHGITTWLNTRGYQVGGSIGKTFSFYTSGFENQARFSNYLTRYINNKGIIPGIVNDKVGGAKTTKDWAYATALLNFTPSKHFSFTLGHDKNFIGDGYRSMLLSDVAAAYPFFKATMSLGNVKYMAMWAQFQDPLSPQFSYDNGYRKKWGAFHYLDWNVNNRLSLGFFDSIIWQDADATGKRGFDASYLNPIIFMRTVEGMNGSPDNALLGLNAKYKLLNNLTLYVQFAADEFTAKEVFKGEGYWANKFAYQLGVKGFDAFKVQGLNYLVEFNTARPFTYSQRSSLLNYGHYTEALAHPMGANFRELLSIWNYQYQKWTFSAQLNRASYGLDNGQNVGKDINSSYNTRIAQNGYYIGNGLKTSFNYAEAKVAYVLNPKYNLRLEVGGLFRQEKNALMNDKTTLFTFGLRSTFRNIYQDF